MKVTAIALMLAATSALAGCRSIADRWDARLVTLRGGRAAERSWRKNQEIYSQIPNRETFAEGYKSGYAHALAGRDSNQPPFPPQAVGAAHSGRGTNVALVQTWLDGFSHGSLAASHDRAAHHQTADQSRELQVQHAAQEIEEPQFMAVPPLPPPSVDELETSAGVNSKSVNKEGTFRDAQPRDSGPTVRYTVSVGTN